MNFLVKKSFLATVTVLFSTIFAVSAQNVQEAPRKTTGQPQSTVNIKPVFAGGATYLTSAYLTQGTTASQSQSNDKQVANEPKQTTAPEPAAKQ
jgi:hypothetical protein